MYLISRTYLYASHSLIDRYMRNFRIRSKGGIVRNILKGPVLLGIGLLLISACAEKSTPSRRDDMRNRSEQALAQLEREVSGGPAVPSGTREERPPAPRDTQKTASVPFAREKPVWIQKPPSGPDAYAGVGAGLDIKSADDAARAEIASQLKVTVGSSFTNTVQEVMKSHQQGKEKSREYSSQEFSESRVHSYVENTTLQGVVIRERWQEGRQVYSLATLSKTGFRDRALNRLEEADRQLASGNISSALRESLRALGEAWVIPDIRVPGSGETIAVAAERKIMNILSSVSAGMRPESAHLASRRELPLSASASVTYDGKPAKGLPIAGIFVSGSGRVESGLTSDSDGNVSLRILSLSPSSRESALALGADLTRLAELPDELNLNLLFPPFTGSRIRISAPPPKVLVAISEKNLGRPQSPSYVESGLAESLTQQGYVLIPRKNLGGEPGDIISGGQSAIQSAGRGSGADLLILGTAESEYYKKMQNTIDVSRVRVVLKVYDGNSGEVIAKLDRSGITGTGRERRQSGTASLREAAKKIPKLVREKLDQI